MQLLAILQNSPPPALFEMCHYSVPHGSAPHAWNLLFIAEDGNYSILCRQCQMRGTMCLGHWVGGRRLCDATRTSGGKEVRGPHLPTIEFAPCHSAANLSAPGQARPGQECRSQGAVLRGETHGFTSAGFFEAFLQGHLVSALAEAGAVHDTCTSQLHSGDAGPVSCPLLLQSDAGSSSSREGGRPPQC